MFRVSPSGQIYKSYIDPTVRWGRPKLPHKIWVISEILFCPPVVARTIAANNLTVVNRIYGFSTAVWGLDFYVLYATLLHLPPLRFQCVGGCWDRTQDCTCLHYRGVYCSWRCLPQGLSCIWTCLHYRGMCCFWRCLHYRGLSCIWACLHGTKCKFI